MLLSVVNSRHDRRRHIHPLRLHRRSVEPVTASPLKSALTNPHTHNFFRIRPYEKWRVSPSPHNKNFISYSRSVPTVRALCSLFHSLQQECFTTPLPTSASALFLKNAGCHPLLLTGSSSLT